jgi:hypothetical protein
MPKAIQADITKPPPAQPSRFGVKILDSHVDRVIAPGEWAIFEDIPSPDTPEARAALHGKLVLCEETHLWKGAAGSGFKNVMRATLQDDGRLRLTFDSKSRHYRGDFETYPSLNPQVEVRVVARVVGKIVDI